MVLMSIPVAKIITIMKCCTNWFPSDSINKYAWTNLILLYLVRMTFW